MPTVHIVPQINTDLLLNRTMYMNMCNEMETGENRKRYIAMLAVP